MKNKLAFVLSFVLAILLVVGTFTYADQSDGIMNMMNGKEMLNMMKVEAMNSHDGQKMMKACSEFIE